MATKQYAMVWEIMVYLYLFNLPFFIMPSIIPTILWIVFTFAPELFDPKNPNSIPYVPQYIAEFGYVLRFQF